MWGQREPICKAGLGRVVKQCYHRARPYQGTLMRRIVYWTSMSEEK